jgi:hypothetical protein
MNKKYKNKIEYDKNYRENNKEKECQRHQKYYENNKEKINEKRKEQITCECGSIFRKSNIAKHNKSKKHQDFIVNNEITVI